MKKATNKISFVKLWDHLKLESELAHDDRFKAVLMNHITRKEYICRKLGVVTEADVARVAAELKQKELKRKKKP